jgi:hypothetical protein
MPVWAGLVVGKGKYPTAWMEDEEESGSLAGPARLRGPNVQGAAPQCGAGKVEVVGAWRRGFLR